MKLHTDSRNPALNTVTGYSPTGIEINAMAYPHSVLLLPEGEVKLWKVANIQDIDTLHIDKMAQFLPELIVLGTGLKQHFLHPSLQVKLTSKRIGLEVMPTAAACRTYNILMAEGRKVLGAFIVEPVVDLNI